MIELTVRPNDRYATSRTNYKIVKLKNAVTLKAKPESVAEIFRIGDSVLEKTLIHWTEWPNIAVVILPYE